jgi:hypothetical protein
MAYRRRIMWDPIDRMRADVVQNPVDSRRRILQSTKVDHVAIHDNPSPTPRTIILQPVEPMRRDSIESIAAPSEMGLGKRWAFRLTFT